MTSFPSIKLLTKFLIFSPLNATFICFENSNKNKSKNKSYREGLLVVRNSKHCRISSSQSHGFLKFEVIAALGPEKRNGLSPHSLGNLANHIQSCIPVLCSAVVDVWEEGNKASPHQFIVAGLFVLLLGNELFDFDDFLRFPLFVDVLFEFIGSPGPFVADSLGGVILLADGEQDQSGVALDLIQLRLLPLRTGIHLGDDDVGVVLKQSPQFRPFRSHVLAMSAPRRIEFDKHHLFGRVDYFLEIVIRQDNDIRHRHILQLHIQPALDLSEGLGPLVSKHIRILLRSLRKVLDRRVISHIESLRQFRVLGSINLPKLKVLPHLGGQSRPIRQQLSAIPVPGRNERNRPAIFLVLHHQLLKVVLIQDHDVLVIIRLVLLALSQGIQFQIMQVPVPLVIPDQTILLLLSRRKEFQGWVRMDLEPAGQLRLRTGLHLRYFHLPFQLARQLLPIRRQLLAMPTPRRIKLYKHCILVAHHHFVKIIISQDYYIAVSFVPQLSLFLLLLLYHLRLPFALLGLLLLFLLLQLSHLRLLNLLLHPLHQLLQLPAFLVLLDIPAFKQLQRRCAVIRVFLPCNGVGFHIQFPNLQP